MHVYTVLLTFSIVNVPSALSRCTAAQHGTPQVENINAGHALSAQAPFFFPIIRYVRGRLGTV
jgi:hypothetical protein